ncbi:MULTISPECIES: hypothetical protein [unclassified Enterococcus]|uniref:hypothetical protein n=1 Tax=unclassified Enterococcus TaxID=2608891 RepID=UPI003B633C1F
MLKKAQDKIFLAENSKLEKTTAYSFGKLSDFDYFITDRNWKDQRCLSLLPG